jgi:hypothetical protein
VQVNEVLNLCGKFKVFVGKRVFEKDKLELRLRLRIRSDWDRIRIRIEESGSILF